MNVWKILVVIAVLVTTLVMSLVPAAGEVFFFNKVTSTEISSSKVTVMPEVSVYHPTLVAIGNADRYSPPDFSKIRVTDRRKEAFFGYLLPMAHKANSEVILERQWLLAMADKLLARQSLSSTQLDELVKFESRYKVRDSDRSTAERIGALLLRVDVVPASLIVAQAAKESGWGTSRFATQGNNFFGIWCFYRGCGLTPLSRLSGRHHEVATFDNVEESVRYYVRTINSHFAYAYLRELRADGRKQQQFYMGELLANGLIRYSERGMSYVREVQSMIRNNKLQRFTRIYRV